MLLKSFKVERRYIRCIRIAKLTIYFVRKKKYIIFSNKFAQTTHLFCRIKIPRRIVRVTDHNRFCARCDHIFELIDRRQGKPIFNRRRYSLHHNAARYGKRHVIRIRRFGDQQLIARIQASQKSKIHSLRCSRRNDNIIRIDHDAETVIIGHHFFTKTEQPFARTVFQDLTIDMTHGIKSYFRRSNIRLPDVEMIDFDSSRFRFIG